MKAISLKLLLFHVVLLFLSNMGFAQVKVLQTTKKLGEADFLFDTFYKIVDCGSGVPTILITAFNESGIKTDVAFDILLKDKNGLTQEIKVPFFHIKRAVTNSGQGT